MRFFNLINLLIINLAFICSCNNQKLRKIINENSQEKNDRYNSIISTASIDSLKLDSVLYYGKYSLNEVHSGRFSYDQIFNHNLHTLSIISKKQLLQNSIEYIISFKVTGTQINISEFNFSNDSNYIYQTSTIKINRQEFDITKLKFLNDSSSIVYPAGLWHGSITGNAIKYYRFNNKEYFLLNGANLYCNGNHCTSYQVYLVTLDKRKINTYAFYIRGAIPYFFDEIKLIDKNLNLYPEIYIPKLNSEELKSMDDFDLYEIMTDSVVKRDSL